MTTIKPALDAAARATIAARVEAILRRAAATSDVAAVLSDPVATSELCAFLGGPHRDPDGEARIDLVIGAGEAGEIMGFETARQLRAGFSIRPPSSPPGRAGRVLIVGPEVPDARLDELVGAVARTGATIVECAVVVDRTVGRPRLASSDGRVHPLRALVRLGARDAGR